MCYGIAYNAAGGDTYQTGHDLGNKILIAASNRIIEAVGQKTFVSRTGGDEFIVVLQGKYSKKKVEFIADKISKNVNRKQEYLDMSLHTTVSIGIAHYPRDGATVEEIIKHGVLRLVNRSSKQKQFS